MAETIHGYRPALASVFKYSHCSLFDGPEITALLKNFALERPMWSQEIPQWSFEPLEKASLVNLTRKTIFLIVFGPFFVPCAGFKIVRGTCLGVPWVLATSVF